MSLFLLEPKIDSGNFIVLDLLNMNYRKQRKNKKIQEKLRKNNFSYLRTMMFDFYDYMNFRNKPSWCNLEIYVSILITN